MNSTLIKLVSPKPASADEKKTNIWLRFSAICVLGFSLSQLDSLGDMSPFAVSFAAGIPFDYCFAAFLGGVVGYFVSTPWRLALRYTFALAMTCVFRLAVLKRFGTADRIFICCLLSFCSTVCSGVAYYTFTEFSAFTVLVLMCEGAFSACGTYFLMRSIRTPVLNIGIKKLSSQDSVCLVICVLVLLMCMSGFTLGEISPARIAAAVFVMFAAQYKGMAASGIAGVLAGLAFAVSPDCRHLFAAYALGGLAAGVFSSLGQYAVSIAFAVSYALALLPDGLTQEKIYLLLEALICAVCYAVVPSKWINTAFDYVDKSGLVADERVEREVCANLRRAARNVDDVSHIVTKASERLDKVINPELDRVFAKLQQNVCFGCAKRNDCWNRHFRETADDIMIITKIKSSAGGKTELEEKCIRPRFLLSEIDKCYGDFVTSMAAKMRLAEMRSVVSEQFSSVAQLLDEIAVQVSNSKILDGAKSRTIKTAFHDGGIDVDSLRYFTDPNSRVTVEAVTINGAPEADHNKMKQLLQLTTGRRFEKPEIAVNELKTVYVFEEKAVFKVHIGSCQIPIGDKKVCGDSIAKLTDMSKNEIAIISDGMGTGSRAAVDSTMTAMLLEKLLSCGFSFDGAMKMVNCALMLKSTDESVATVDAVKINVFTGRAYFHKAGAAVSFIRRNETVTVIEEPSMPLGIIRELAPAAASRDLRVGDTVLLVSDGVTAGDCGWINDELIAWSTGNMKDLASHIASLARLRNGSTAADDITVIALRLLKN